MENYISSLLVVAAIGLYIALIIVCSRNTHLQSEAVKRGYAEWVCDLNGNSTFQWKGAK